MKQKLGGTRRLLLIILLSALGGGIAGVAIGILHDTHDFTSALTACKNAAAGMIVPLTLLLSLVTGIADILALRRIRHLMQDVRKAEDDEADRLDHEIAVISSWLFVIAGITQILSIFFISEAMDYYLVREAAAASYGFFPAVFSSVLLSAVSSVCTLRLYHLIRTFYHKEGEPGDRNWSEIYFQSLDEAEQMAAYRAFRKTTEKTSRSIVILMCIAMAANVLFRTGTFPVLLLAVLYIRMQYTYQRTSLKEGK